MSAGEKKPDTQSQDIDLLLLIERSIRFFKTYKMIFLIAILAGLGLGTYFYLSSPKVYKSRLIIHSYILSNQEQIQIVQNWNALLKRREHTTLSKIFNCREEILICVKSIRAAEIEKLFIAGNPNGFTIDVIFSDTSALKELEDGLVFGLDNTEYARDRVAVKKGKLTGLINKTNTEIRELDSTKQLIRKIISGNGNASSSLILDGTSINRELVLMNEKLEFFKEELEFSNSIQLLQGFNGYRASGGPGLIIWLFMGLITGLCVGWAYALFHSINKALNRRSRN